MLIEPARRRHRPYTANGIRRVRCSVGDCPHPAYATWQLCADGRTFRGICIVHDVALNRMVLEWVQDPEIEAKMAKYLARPAVRVALGEIK